MRSAAWWLNADGVLAAQSVQQLIDLLSTSSDDGRCVHGLSLLGADTFFERRLSSDAGSVVLRCRHLVSFKNCFWMSLLVRF